MSFHALGPESRSWDRNPGGGWGLVKTPGCGQDAARGGRNPRATKSRKRSFPENLSWLAPIQQLCSQDLILFLLHGHISLSLSLTHTPAHCKNLGYSLLWRSHLPELLETCRELVWGDPLGHCLLPEGERLQPRPLKRPVWGTVWGQPQSTGLEGPSSLLGVARPLEHSWCSWLSRVASLPQSLQRGRHVTLWVWSWRGLGVPCSVPAVLWAAREGSWGPGLGPPEASSWDSWNPLPVATLHFSPRALTSSAASAAVFGWLSPRNWVMSVPCAKVREPAPCNSETAFPTLNLSRGKY